MKAAVQNQEELAVGGGCGRHRQRVNRYLRSSRAKDPAVIEKKPSVRKRTHRSTGLDLSCQLRDRYRSEEQGFPTRFSFHRFFLSFAVCMTCSAGHRARG